MHESSSFVVCDGKERFDRRHALEALVRVP
jgi:hypothetical protein